VVQINVGLHVTKQPVNITGKLVLQNITNDSTSFYKPTCLFASQPVVVVSYIGQIYARFLGFSRQIYLTHGIKPKASYLRNFRNAWRKLMNAGNKYCCFVPTNQ